MNLYHCFAPIFAYGLLLQKTVAVRQPPLAQVDAKVRDLFRDSARCMSQNNIDPRDFDDARFAVAAWLDETLLNMPWQYRDQWRRHLLQVEMYGTSNAGGLFFERLEQLQPHQNKVREIYYRCLALGFSGRYGGEGDDFLLGQLKKASLRAITGADLLPSSYSKQAMFAGAYQAGQAGGDLRTGAMRRQWNTTRLALALLPPTLLLVLYFIYNYVLNGVAGNLLGGAIGV